MALGPARNVRQTVNRAYGTDAIITAVPIASRFAVAHDDPLVVRMNIFRLQLLLNTEIDEAARRTVSQIINKFEEAAAHGARYTRQATPL